MHVKSSLASETTKWTVVILDKQEPFEALLARMLDMLDIQPQPHHQPLSLFYELLLDGKYVVDDIRALEDEDQLILRPRDMIQVFVKSSIVSQVTDWTAVYLDDSEYQQQNMELLFRTIFKQLNIQPDHNLCPYGPTRRVYKLTANDGGTVLLDPSEIRSGDRLTLEQRTDVEASTSE
jgi:hypothetical protein